MSPAGSLPIAIALLAALAACSPRPAPIVLHPPAPVHDRVVHRQARPARPNRATTAVSAATGASATTPASAAPAPSRTGQATDPADLSTSEREDLLRDFDAYLSKSAPAQ